MCHERLVSLWGLELYRGDQVQRPVLDVVELDSRSAYSQHPKLWRSVQHPCQMHKVDTFNPCGHVFVRKVPL